MPRDPHDSLSERDRRDITALADGARVIGSDGSLTGYRGGIERKRALLAKEAKTKFKLRP